MGVGNNIKYYRKEKNMSQEELAARIEKSVRMIQKYESNQVLPGLDLVDKIADAFGVDRFSILAHDEGDFIDSSTHLRFRLFINSIGHDLYLWYGYDSMDEEIEKGNSKIATLDGEDLSSEEYKALYNRISDFVHFEIAQLMTRKNIEPED